MLKKIKQYADVALSICRKYLTLLIIGSKYVSQEHIFFPHKMWYFPHIK